MNSALPPQPAKITKINTIASIGRILILIALILILVFVVSWVFGCSIIPVPGYCDFYWSLTGTPKTLIVYGDTGLGNPKLLARELSNPKGAKVRTTSMHLSRISPALLKNYTLIIVTKAKKMSASQMKMFMDYVFKGGRLVWTGDAGTQVTTLIDETQKQANERELLFKDEDPETKSYSTIDVNKHEAINPWARKLGGNTLRFDRFISAAYIGNYCNQKKTTCDELPYIGKIQLNDSKHDAVIGLKNNWKCFGNIALVQVINSTSTLRIADISNTSKLGTGTSYPFIIESGFGGRVLYYALPPEEFINPKIPFDKKGNQWMAPHIISNMYQAAIK